MADLNLSSVRLPPAFQECEYIESTGNAWIDTGVYLSQNSNFDIWYKNKTSNTSGNYGFGYYNCDGFTLEEQAWFTGNILQFGTSLSEGYSFPSGFYNDGIRHIVAINDLLYVDGLLYGSLQRTGTATASATLLLGAGREDAASNIKGSTFGVILGKMTFSTNDIDIFRGIPCYLKTAWNNIPAGTVGMYDLCGSLSSNGTPFYTNEGTGAFSKGPDVVHADAITINGAEVEKLTDANDIAWTKYGLMLPPMFQRCEYIESHGTEWIDTVWYPSTLSEIEMRIKFLDESSEAAIGSRNAAGTSQPDFLAFFGTLPTKRGIAMHWCYNGRNSVDTTYISTVDISAFREIIYGKNGLIVDGVRYYVAPTISGNAVCINSYSIFASKNGSSGQLSKFGSFQLSRFRCATNGVIERDFIPCYLRTDWNGIPAGTIGMYDLCGSISNNGTPFYTNEGTGAFTKGADV